MIKVCQNLHTHTIYCDGNNTLEEMAISAVEKGMTSIGFSGHALTPHDVSYCMSYENTLKYADDVFRVRQKYKDRLKVYLGLEQDYFSVKPIIDCDYIIGSVHYVLKDGNYIPVDETRGDILNAVDSLYGGDIYSFLENYYLTVADIYNKTGCDIVGHFDLPEKFNADGKMFDRENPRYVKAYQNAVDILISQGRIFEINTGGMCKGYTKNPYPNSSILKYLALKNGKITVSSDSHTADTVDYMLNEMYDYAKNGGVDKIYFLTENGFECVEL